VQAITPQTDSTTTGQNVAALVAAHRHHGHGADDRAIAICEAKDAFRNVWVPDEATGEDPSGRAQIEEMLGGVAPHLELTDPEWMAIIDQEEDAARVWGLTDDGRERYRERKAQAEKAHKPMRSEVLRQTRVFRDFLAQDRSLSPTAILVMRFLFDHMNEAQGMVAWPGLPTLCAETHLCRMTVIKAVKELDAASVIAVVSGVGHATNRYALQPSSRWGKIRRSGPSGAPLPGMNGGGNGIPASPRFHISDSGPRGDDSGPRGDESGPRRGPNLLKNVIRTTRTARFSSSPSVDQS
jgi:Helix-turn-helix domain